MSRTLQAVTVPTSNSAQPSGLTTDYSLGNMVGLVDSELNTFFEKQIAQAESTLGQAYADLWRTIQTVVMGGGKRLRPYLAMLTYGALGGRLEELSLGAISSLELLHQCLLVHDDVIDRDYIRHGQKNVAGLIHETYRALGGFDLHYADSAAILAGDLLLNGAFSMLNDVELPDATKLAAMRVLNQAVFQVGGGELLDSESVLRPIEEVDSLLVAQYKTASYSFVAPLLMGALLAGAELSELRALRSFGESLGIAYQLRDDVLGVFGDQAITGKSSLSDIREAKRTYLLQRTILLCDSQQERIIQTILGKENVSLAAARRVAELMSASGALEATESAIDSYCHLATESLEKLAFTGPFKQELRHFIQTASQRVQ